MRTARIWFASIAVAVLIAGTAAYLSPGGSLLYAGTARVIDNRQTRKAAPGEGQEIAASTLASSDSSMNAEATGLGQGATALAAPSGAQENVVSTIEDRPGKIIPFGPSRLNNNVWGRPDAEQLESSVFLKPGNSFGWNWSRPNPMKKPGNEFVQPIYPSIKIGGSPWDSSRSDRFPIRVGDINSLLLEVSYNYEVPPNGTYDLAYDLWLSESNGPQSAPKPNAEVMIWLHGTLGQPAKAYRGDFSDGLNTFSLYSFTTSGGRQYYAFLLKGEPQFNGDVTVDAGKLMKSLTLNPDWYLHGVEFGNEVVSGSGKIDVSKLIITLNGQPI